MKKLFLLAFLPSVFLAQKAMLTNDIILKLAEKPLHCLNQEYPNKTAHIINGDQDARLTPKQLHPSFYGCFDWHSSVHGHWMLVKLLKLNPTITESNKILEALDNNFQAEKLKKEAEYFTKYNLAHHFERTYGWAWLLKLDEELATWDHPKAKEWHGNLKPLTDKILASWKVYLPKQTYPNRTGVHSNSAFALAFALDWARSVKDTSFEKQLVEKSLYFYQNDKKTPAYLEPDGSDFFSPSLQIADLMRRVLPQKEFANWLTKFYDKRSVDNIYKIPVVSDLNDYQTVHLVGLSFSRAWCMKGVSKALPEGHALKKPFLEASDKFLNNGLPLVFQGNYGGDHWLGSFAVYAMSVE